MRAWESLAVNTKPDLKNDFQSTPILGFVGDRTHRKVTRRLLLLHLGEMRSGKGENILARTFFRCFCCFYIFLFCFGKEEKFECVGNNFKLGEEAAAHSPLTLSVYLSSRHANVDRISNWIFWNMRGTLFRARKIQNSNRVEEEHGRDRM